MPQTQHIPTGPASPCGREGGRTRPWPSVHTAASGGLCTSGNAVPPGLQGLGPVRLKPHGMASLPAPPILGLAEDGQGTRPGQGWSGACVSPGGPAGNASECASGRMSVGPDRQETGKEAKGDPGLTLGGCHGNGEPGADCQETRRRRENRRAWLRMEGRLTGRAGWDGSRTCSGSLVDSRLSSQGCWWEQGLPSPCPWLVSRVQPHRPGGKVAGGHCSLQEGVSALRRAVHGCCRLSGPRRWAGSLSDTCYPLAASPGQGPGSAGDSGAWLSLRPPGPGGP